MKPALSAVEGLGLIDEDPFTRRGSSRRSPLGAETDRGNRPMRLPSDMSASAEAEVSAKEGTTRHGVASDRSRVPSDSPALPPLELTEEEKDNLPF